MNELTTIDYIKGIIIIALCIIILYGINDYFFTIKNTLITEQNYKTINNEVQNSKELSLQEKVNFKTNYFLFGRKIIGYKVRDIIKKIEI